MKVLVNLIGEQSIPNILPAMFLKPDKNVILYTAKTKCVANRISNILSNCENVLISAYEFGEITNKISGITSSKDKYIFNITGGTKLMSLALFQFGVQNNSEIAYLQSEKNKNILYRFSIDKNDSLISKTEEITEAIDLDLYLKAHLNGYEISTDIDQTQFGIKYENAVVQVLRSNNFEVLQSVKPVGEGNQLEIDIAFRLKGTNNVGIAEVKIGDAKMERPKKGIDQLSTAGSREYLGTYTKKFLITRRKINKSLCKLAAAHNIVVIDRISANNKNVISEIAQKKLITTITKHLK